MKMKELPKATIQIQRDELLEQVKKLTIERKNLSSCIENLKSDGITLRKTIAEKDVIINGLKEQEKISQKSLKEEQEKTIKKEQERKLLETEVNKLKPNLKH